MLDIATYHPTFLYESLWNIGVAALVLWAARRFPLGHGRTFALYVAAYTVGRFWTEYLRIDEAHTFLGGLLSAGDFGGVGVVLAADALPGVGGVLVDTEQSTDHDGREFGGQLDEGSVAGHAGPDAERMEAADELAAAEVLGRESAWEQPALACGVSGHRLGVERSPSKVSWVIGPVPAARVRSTLSRAGRRFSQYRTLVPGCLSRALKTGTTPGRMRPPGLRMSRSRARAAQSGQRP